MSDEKTYSSRQGAELVNPVVVEQRHLDELQSRIAELEEEVKALQGQLAALRSAVLGEIMEALNELRLK